MLVFTLTPPDGLNQVYSYSRLCGPIKSGRHTCATTDASDSSRRPLAGPPTDKRPVLAYPLGVLALPGLGAGLLDGGHHLLLGDEVVDALEQAEQALHVEAPLVEDVVGVARLGEADDARGAVDLGEDRLGRHQLADVLLGFVLGQVEQLRQAAHLDARVVLGDDAHVVLDDALAQVLPPLEGLVLVVVVVGLVVEDVGARQVGPEHARHLGPAHELVNGEELEQLGVVGHHRVARVLVDPVQEVVLLVVVGREDDEVDDALQDLLGVSDVREPWGVLGVSDAPTTTRKHTMRSCFGFSSMDSVSSTCL